MECVNCLLYVCKPGTTPGETLLTPVVGALLENLGKKGMNKLGLALPSSGLDLD